MATTDTPASIGVGVTATPLGIGRRARGCRAPQSEHPWARGGHPACHTMTITATWVGGWVGRVCGLKRDVHPRHPGRPEQSSAQNCAGVGRDAVYPQGGGAEERGATRVQAVQGSIRDIATVPFPVLRQLGTEQLSTSHVIGDPTAKASAEPRALWLSGSSLPRAPPADAHHLFPSLSYTPQM